MPASPPSPGLVETLVYAGRRRIASAVRRRECFYALAVAVLGCCALLLLGTRYVPWALLPLGAALGVWAACQRWKSGVPGSYAIAQLIDSHEDLSDELATAYHFRTNGNGAARPSLADTQYRRACRTAAGIVPEAVFPTATPWTQRASLWLLAAAVVLFGLRAAVQPKLSFEPPLATLLLHTLLGYPADRADAALAAAARIDGPPPATAASEEQEAPPGHRQNSAPSGLDLPEEQYSETREDAEDLPEVEGLLTVPLDEVEVEGLDADDGLASAAVDDEAASEDGATPPPDPSDESWDEEAQSLLDKLKQAFENMLETLDMASVEGADSEAGREQGSGQAEEAAAEGEPADSGSAENSDGGEADEAAMEGGEQGEAGDEAASAGGQGEDSSGEQSSGENASAAGSSDGSKEFAEAAREEVLGALEELYMERAENMRGDVTVETRLAEQSASVPYNRRVTAHADRGGAISRDEIPAAYRAYIRNYFETLRRIEE